MRVAKNRTLSCSYVTALGWFLTVYYNWATMELQIVVCYSSWTPRTSHFKEQKCKIKARTPYHMSARTEDGRPDCKKKVRAWSPMRNMKERGFDSMDMDIDRHQKPQTTSALSCGADPQKESPHFLIYLVVCHLAPSFVTAVIRCLPVILNPLSKAQLQIALRSFKMWEEKRTKQLPTV